MEFVAPIRIAVQGPLGAHIDDPVLLRFKLLHQAGKPLQHVCHDLLLDSKILNSVIPMFQDRAVFLA